MLKRKLAEFSDRLIVKQCRFFILVTASCDRPKPEIRFLPRRLR